MKNKKQKEEILFIIATAVLFNAYRISDMVKNNDVAQDIIDDLNKKGYKIIKYGNIKKQ